MFERERERALATAAEAREPEDNALLAERGLALLPVDASFVPLDVRTVAHVIRRCGRRRR